jgi:hypothetical protein
MITYDDSTLTVDQRGKLDLTPRLKDFAMQVYFAKPMINFVVTKECLTHPRKTDNSLDTNTHVIDCLHVYEDGERLGSISTDMRYRGGDKDEVYGVSSFRISKERGNQNKTMSKDIKVALRTAKKMLVSRANEEVSKLIRGLTGDNLNSISNQCETEVRWSIDATTEGMRYAQAAYDARLRGEETVTLPATLKSIKDMREHNKKFEEAVDAIALKNAFKNHQGYGTQTLSNGNIYVLNFANNELKRYKEFDELPLDIQNKYGMSKVLKEQEPALNIGIWFERDDVKYMYIAP